MIVSIHKNLDSFNTYVEFLLQTLDLVTNKKLTFLVVVDGFKLHNMAAAERFFLLYWENHVDHTILLMWLDFFVNRHIVQFETVCKSGFKNHATSWAKKNHANLLGRKINHVISRATSQAKKKSNNLLGQKKSRNLSGKKKKSCDLSGQKKIMQPRRPKKNHATSWAKKISRNLLGQKKIMQPLGPKNQSNQGNKGNLYSSQHSKLFRQL